MTSERELWSKEQEKFFDRLSQSYGLYDFAHESRPAKRFADEFLNFLELRPGTRVLEFGCGRGEWVLRLLSQGYAVTGIDISQKSLAVLAAAAENLGLSSRLRLFRGNAQQDALAGLVGKDFATVFCYNLLHHVWDIERTVVNMVSLTEYGGKVVAYEPNPWHVWWYFCPFFDKKFEWSYERGLRHTAPWKIKKVFERAGLKDVTVIPGDFFPFISAEKTLYLTAFLQKLLSRMPLVKNFSVVYLIGGYKR